MNILPPLELFRAWPDIVGVNIAARTKPFAISAGLFTIAADSAAVTDHIKFIAQDIIDAINLRFPQFNINRLRCIRAKFHINPIAVVPALDDISPADAYDCKKKASVICSDNRTADIAANALAAHRRLINFRLQNGWHKCRACGTLCPPDQIFCDVCSINRRN